MASSGAPNSKGEGGARWRMTVVGERIAASCPDRGGEPGNRALTYIVAAGNAAVERADFLEPSEGANILMKSASLRRSGAR
jgi:hypothetical protein